MNTLITKNYLQTLRYFISASYHDIYFFVNIARLQDSRVREILNLLIAARNRGVIINGIVNLKARQSMDEYNSRQFGNTLSKNGANIYFPKTGVCMHAKAFCFDRKTLILGSHNLSGSADTKNIELSILTSNTATMSRFIEIFEHITERCTQK